ncbi:MAG: hypothetical protein AABY61_13680 [Nitrospirota bacterium]
MGTLLKLIFLLLTAISVAVPAVGHSFESMTRVWTFDDDLPRTLPANFQVSTFFNGRPAGDWKVFNTDHAKSSPHVLAQLLGKGAEHAYETVFINGIKASDLELEVSFLPIEGKAYMGGGLIWRATDDRNYYLTRADPLEQNIRIYRVFKGVRYLLKNLDQIIDVRLWHTLRVSAKGCQVQVFLDGKEMFNLCDQTFSTGQVGLWTKSGAVTYFDDLKLRSMR